MALLTCSQLNVATHFTILNLTRVVTYVVDLPYLTLFPVVDLPFPVDYLRWFHLYGCWQPDLTITLIYALHCVGYGWYVGLPHRVGCCGYCTRLLFCPVDYLQVVTLLLVPIPVTQLRCLPGCTYVVTLQTQLRCAVTIYVAVDLVAGPRWIFVPVTTFTG